MSLRNVPGTGRTYHLISYDEAGREKPDPDGSSARETAIAAMTEPAIPDRAADITDVFILSHGWQGDVVDAVRQYDRWIAAADPTFTATGIRPLVIGVHWPSKMWSSRELTTSSTGLLGDDTAAGPADGITVDEAVEEFAAVLGDAPDIRAALTTILDYASGVAPDRSASAADELPPWVVTAYKTLGGVEGPTGDDPLLAEKWDPSAAFDGAAQPEADPGVLAGGRWAKLRDAILAPLRQLTFWAYKDRARAVGETGVADLVRNILDRTPSTVRLHLSGHSFGTIVVSGAVRGGGDRPVPPSRPVTSMCLVQGAVSLWAYAPSVPQRHGGGRGYFADLLSPDFVSGPIGVTRSRWDYAVGRFYPLAARIAGQYLLGEELPRFGGIGSFGAAGIADAVELPPLVPGQQSVGPFARGIYNLDAGGVIAALDGISGAHNDIAHPELSVFVRDLAIAR